MIFVDRRRVSVPESLSSARARNVRDRLAKLLATASKRHLNQLRVSFEPTDIWRQVRAELAVLFHGKCAYCESSGMTSPLDVSTFDPSRAHGSTTMRRRRSTCITAGLLMSGTTCCWCAWNAIFGVTSGRGVERGSALSTTRSARAPFRASVEECRRVERPLFLDPCHDDPAEHLTFLESGFARPHTPRGDFVIESLRSQCPSRARRDAKEGLGAGCDARAAYAQCYARQRPGSPGESCHRV